MGTTTNLGLTYPAATALVSQGYAQIQTLAQDVDGFYGAMTSYTPTFSNCTSPVVDARYRKVGRMLHVMIDGTSGTVTAAGTIGISLPLSLVNISARTPVSAEYAGVGVVHAWIPASGTSIAVAGTAAGGNFAAGAGLGNLSLNVVLSVTS